MNTSESSFVISCIHKLYEYREEVKLLEDNEYKDMIISRYLEEVISEIDIYFATTRIDRANLKHAVLELIHELYLHAYDESDELNEDMYAYYKQVFAYLFEKIHELEIRIFFILQNQLLDREFLTMLSVFQKCNIVTITPYGDDEEFDLETTTHTVTKLRSREYEDVENDIAYAVAHRQHLMYIEKDANVNYIQKILIVAEELHSSYLVLYRNKAPDIPKALYLHGHFKEIAFIS